MTAAAAAWTIAGCSKPDAGAEIVASVNGDGIKVKELREFLGARGAGARTSGIPVEKKREALDRLIAGRLLAGEARARGLDNTDAFRTAMQRGADAVLISALFRKEEASQLKIAKGDIKAEADKLRAADKTLSEDNAALRAGRAVTESKLRKLEEDLIAAAKKDVPSTVNQAELDKLAKGDVPADGTVLATVGDAKVTYGEVKALLENMSGGGHGGNDLAKNPVAVARMVERETLGKTLAAHAKKQGVVGSEWEKAARSDMERSVLIDMIAEKEVAGADTVSDKEVADAYSQHAQMFVQDGKKIPLAAVKERLKGFLRNEKRKKALEALIAGLKTKAKITVNDALLSEV